MLDVVPGTRPTPRLFGLHGPLVAQSLAGGSQYSLPVARADGGRGNSARTPLAGNRDADHARAWLNGLDGDRDRPRNCCRHWPSRSLREAHRCATIAPSATGAGPAGPARAKLLQPAMSTIDQGLRRDSAFKLFVHHQTFIRHLLSAYRLLGIDEREVVAIDAGNANLVAAGRQGQRLPDAVWRLTLADGEIAYLLIECQAEIDPSMPFRILHAAAGMYLILSQLCWPQHNGIIRDSA